MYNRRGWRSVILIIACISLVGTLVIIGYNEMRFCLGVQILSTKELEEIVQYPETDLSVSFFFKGEPAALDVESSTIYISQSIDEETKVYDLIGELSITDRNYAMFFAPDSKFDFLLDAVKQGHKFRLLVTSNGKNYAEYSVVLTTMPVVCLEGKSNGYDEEGRSLWNGRFTMWSPEDPSTDSYCVINSEAEWNVRGHSTSHQPKKSWKITLKNGKGENSDANLLGLGEDDDWLLNAMSYDDCKLREKLISDLWNDMAEATPYNYRMSTGEYIEIIINGEYSGVYLLQRRLDGKYLGLGENQVAIKGENVYAKDPSIINAASEVTSRVADKVDCTTVDLDNWIDVALFIDFTFAPDNSGIPYFYNNMLYVVTDPQNDPSISLVLWDTDMSLGMHIENALVYRPTWAMSESHIRRMEYSSLSKVYPDLDARMAARWGELRNGVLTEDNILVKVESYVKILDQTGALQRDRDTWGEYSQREDTVGMLLEIVKYRLTWLDQVYGVR